MSVAATAGLDCTRRPSPKPSGIKEGKMKTSPPFAGAGEVACFYVKPRPPAIELCPPLPAQISAGHDPEEALPQY